MADIDETIRRVPDLIARVRELDAAATKGPWMLGHWFGQCKAKHTHRGPPERGGDCIYEYEWRPHTTDAESLRCICAPPNLTLIQGNDWGPQPSRVDDAALIAYYRTAAPQLADECERLRERVRVLEAALEWYADESNYDSDHAPLAQHGMPVPAVDVDQARRDYEDAQDIARMKDAGLADGQE